VAVNSIYASIIPSYKYNLVLKSFSYGTQVMGHPVQVHHEPSNLVLEDEGEDVVLVMVPTVEKTSRVDIVREGGKDNDVHRDDS
jgi:hypothetical protein